MDFSLGKYNSPTKQLITEDQKPQFSHFVPKIISDNHFKQKLLTQNKALARKNSILMTKISDLETKISELIQHNIELRAVNAKAENQKRKWLEDKLNVIEEGVNQRFGEMIQMFQTIRANEGLSMSEIKLNGMMVGFTSEGSSTNDKSVSFQTAASPKKASKSERRRKSLRRQSIYIPPPDSPIIYEQAISQFDKNVERFPNTEPKFDLTLQITQPENEIHQMSQEEEQEKNQEQGKIQDQYQAQELEQEEEIHLYYDNDNPFQENTYENMEDIIQQHQAEAIEKLSELEEQEQQKVGQEQQNEEEEIVLNEHDDLTQESTLSPIRLSSSSSLEKKSSKFMVYEDSPEVGDNSINKKIEKLVSSSVHNAKVTKRHKKSIKPITNKQKDNESTSSELSDIQKPLIHDTNKVKHTKSKKKKSKFVLDDSMPGTSSQDNDELSTRRSRTRGKQVSYTEPSLRAKMRRQSEKFVGAADEEAYDAYVNNVLINRRRTITPEVSRERIDLDEKEEEQKANTSIEKPIFTHNDEDLARNIKDSRESPIKFKGKTLLEQDNINITKRRKPLSTLNSNKIAKIVSDPMQKIKHNQKIEQPKVTEEDNLDEADLSVFDLVEESSVGVPKTTYKGNPDINLKKRNKRRHSMIL